MDKFAKMGRNSQGEPYENIVETNYGYDVAHDIVPPNPLTPHNSAHHAQYYDYHNEPQYVEEHDASPYVDPG